MGKKDGIMSGTTSRWVRWRTLSGDKWTRYGRAPLVRIGWLSVLLTPAMTADPLRF